MKYYQTPNLKFIEKGKERKEDKEEWWREQGEKKKKDKKKSYGVVPKSKLHAGINLANGQ